MDDLKNTTVITADEAEALKLFSSAITEENVLTVVVLGNDDKRKNLVERADTRAGIDILGYKGRVIWIHDPTVLNNEIKMLKPGKDKDGNVIDISNVDLTEVVAFSVSRNKTVKCIIRDTDLIDAFTPNVLFSNASLKDD